MQNLILFQTVKNSNAEFEFQWQKKLKNKNNFVHADQFSFEKNKMFLIKNSSSK